MERNYFLESSRKHESKLIHRKIVMGYKQYLQKGIVYYEKETYTHERNWSEFRKPFGKGSFYLFH